MKIQFTLILSLFYLNAFSQSKVIWKEIYSNASDSIDIPMPVITTYRTPEIPDSLIKNYWKYYANKEPYLNIFFEEIIYRSNKIVLTKDVNTIPPRLLVQWTINEFGESTNVVFLDFSNAKNFYLEYESTLEQIVETIESSPKIIPCKNDKKESIPFQMTWIINLSNFKK